MPFAHDKTFSLGVYINVDFFKLNTFTGQQIFSLLAERAIIF
jgi:hypothetical protein